MRKFYLPFFFKFILIFIIISTLPILILSFQTNRILKPSLRTLYLELHTKTLSNISMKIQSYFETLSRILPFVEETISRTDIDWNYKQNTLESLMSINKNIISISVLDINGKEKIKIYNPDIISEPKLEDLSQQPFFIKFRDSKENRTFKFISEEDLFQINSFYKKQNFYLRISMSINDLFEELKETKIGKTGSIILISAEDNSLIFTTQYHKEILNDILSNPILETAKQSISIGSKETKIKDEDYIVSYIFLPHINWILLLQQTQKEAYLPVKILTKQTTQVIILLLIISAIISSIIAAGISQPILKIIEAARSVASGNFNVSINIKTYDELEILGNTFNHMAKKLNEYAEIQLDKLIAEKTKTEAIIFSIKDGIILTDYEGNILLINKRAKDILNIKSENLENLNIFQLLDEKLKPIMKDVINQPNKIFEIDLSTENFSKFYQAISLPVATPKNEKIGIVSVLHDITLEKEIDKMKDDFLHSITHDLRNPMTSIRGFIKFLLDGTAGEINEQQKKILETIDRASFKLLNMINDILDIAKLEAGKMEVMLEEVNITKIISSVIELLQPQYERKNIKLIFNPQKDSIKVLVDPKLIERVYINLIGNAIKFTPEEGTIKVDVYESENYLESFVEDTGEGIPKEYLDKIFEKFGQVKNKSKGGTGLGLTICKYIIELHKGKIWVESEVGKGSKFIFRLPK
ncbi:MAG: ATP-binding protein [Elusimicrobiota bacterium]|nr:ATP-binding protein [Endomicrobiia bacterium]MDW8165752.1 ATP-binding protein [Elusimicrobiota bacterium]